MQDVDSAVIARCEGQNYAHMSELPAQGVRDVVGYGDAQHLRKDC